MGPRSENRGYRSRSMRSTAIRGSCFNGSTVREPWLSGSRRSVRNRRAGRFNGSTVREPWLSTPISATRLLLDPLQWVHGPRTVVIFRSRGDRGVEGSASMGPRSENRGYQRRTKRRPIPRRSFNGSTVREPWLCFTACPCATGSRCRFNGSTVREPWLSGPTTAVFSRGRWASMGPRSENRGYRWRLGHEWCAPSSLQWVHGPRTVVIEE